MARTRVKVSPTETYADRVVFEVVEDVAAGAPEKPSKLRVEYSDGDVVELAAAALGEALVLKANPTLREVCDALVAFAATKPTAFQQKAAGKVRQPGPRD